MKTEVYSWRLTQDLKARLEAEARSAGVPVAAILDRITRAWLDERQLALADEESEQARIRERVLRFVGTIAGDDPGRSRRDGGS